MTYIEQLEKKLACRDIIIENLLTVIKGYAINLDNQVAWKIHEEAIDYVKSRKKTTDFG